MELLNKNLSELKVSLLCQNVLKAQKLSKELRKMGIYAHFFNEIHDFWASCLHKADDVLIVDNELLEGAGVSLVEHPRIRNRELPIIINCEEPRLLRVDLLENLRCLGFINPSWPASEQLQVLMNSVLAFEQVEQERKRLLSHRERLRHRNLELNESFEKAKQFSDEFLFINKVIDLFDEKLELGFENALNDIFENLNFVNHYGIWGINESETQVITLHQSNRKTTSLIQLWEDKNLNTGMKPLLIERLVKNAQVQLGGDIIPLKIKGHKDFPEILIALSVQDKGSHLFPWKTLEEKLSWRYLKTKVSDEKILSGGRSWSVWQLMSYLDEVYYQCARAPHGLIKIDFKSLLSLVTSEEGNVFLWETFKRDFEREIIKLLGQGVTFIDYGVEAMILMVDRDKVSQALLMLEDLMEFFEFWRYFENQTIVLAKTIVPQVGVLASASMNFLKEREPLFKRTSTKRLNHKVFEWNENHAN